MKKRAKDVEVGDIITSGFLSKCTDVVKSVAITPRGKYVFYGRLYTNSGGICGHAVDADQWMYVIIPSKFVNGDAVYDAFGDYHTIKSVIPNGRDGYDYKTVGGYTFPEKELFFLDELPII